MELTEIQKQIMSGKICPYCKQPSVLTDSTKVYGRSYGMIYYCAADNAWVGVHKGTDKALGRMANGELREAKKEAHKYFDKIWMNKLTSRTEAYQWLSRQLDLPAEYTHIGMFGVETCRKVVYFSKQLLNDNRRADLDFGAKPITEHFNI